MKPYYLWQLLAAWNHCPQALNRSAALETSRSCWLCVSGDLVWGNALWQQPVVIGNGDPSDTDGETKPPRFHDPLPGSLVTASLLEPSAAQKVMRFLVSGASKGRKMKWEDVGVKLGSVRCRGNSGSGEREDLPSVYWGVKWQACVRETFNIFKTPLELSKLSMREISLGNDIPVPSPLQTYSWRFSSHSGFPPRCFCWGSGTFPAFNHQEAETSQRVSAQVLLKSKRPFLAVLGRFGALELQLLSCFSDTVLWASHSSERPSISS